MIIRMNLDEKSYDIVVDRGILNSVSELLETDRKALIITDSGVPVQYAEKVAEQVKEPFIVTIPEGEKSKNFDNYKMLLKVLVDESFTRTDCVIAVGGGVVGDLAGFVASSFMRGIDFYNIPTTLLSQIDSSIGGKVAIDFEGIKNIVGAFYQPKKVLIDPDVLKTLPDRQVSNGLAEAIKMSLTHDEKLFEFFENEDFFNSLDTVIIKSLNIKKSVVEQDEKETGLRRVLNFGHTIGHGIESEQEGKLFHGECVALGMIPMCSEEVRDRLINVLKKANLPINADFRKQVAFEALKHDKKFKGNKVTLIKVDKAGTFKEETATENDILDLLDILEEF